MRRTPRLASLPRMIATAGPLFLLFLSPVGLRSGGGDSRPDTDETEACPIPGARPADDLIEDAEKHFARLWMLTDGGENAEAYWSFSGDRLVFQRRNQALGIECDRIFVLERAFESFVPVSDGTGVTTCSYFLPGDERIVYASTRAAMASCPPPPDFSQGYVWPIHAGFDLWTRDLASGELARLTDEPGYDAEATVSPRGDRMVFTSTRSGDLELWTCGLDGSDPVQVTDALGYDGGAFFSHDGTKLVFRATSFTPGKEADEHADYRRLLGQGLVRPSKMEIFVIDADGRNRRQVTELGGASFAPFFFPDDRRILFASNHHEQRARNFDLFAVGTDGEGLERVTTYSGFDSFPMFSPDGRYLVFASNRGGSAEGDTNVFVALWKD